jgi:hypothetical protein
MSFDPRVMQRLYEETTADYLLAEFAYDEGPVSDALTVADQTIGPHGQPLTDQRFSDMLQRHGLDSPNARAHPERAPAIRAAAHRVQAASTRPPGIGRGRRLAPSIWLTSSTDEERTGCWASSLPPEPIPLVPRMGRCRCSSFRPAPFPDGERVTKLLAGAAKPPADEYLRSLAGVAAVWLRHAGR